MFQWKNDSDYDDPNEIKLDDMEEELKCRDAGNDRETTHDGKTLSLYDIVPSRKGEHNGWRLRRKSCVVASMMETKYNLLEHVRTMTLISNQLQRR